VKKSSKSKFLHHFSKKDIIRLNSLKKEKNTEGATTAPTS